MLGLRFCARAFSSGGERGPLVIAVRGPLTIAASLVAEHRLQTLRLSSCGSRAQLLRGMWDLPRPGLEPVCPALASRFSTTAPPGKTPPFYVKKADSHVNEKLPHTVKNHLFPDFRAFCCRYFICRMPMEARYGQRKTNVYNLRGSLSFTKYFTVLGITETKQILVRNVFL